VVLGSRAQVSAYCRSPTARPPAGYLDATLVLRVDLLPISNEPILASAARPPQPADEYSTLRRTDCVVKRAKHYMYLCSALTRLACLRSAFMAAAGRPGSEIATKEEAASKDRSSCGRIFWAIQGLVFLITGSNSERAILYATSYAGGPLWVSSRSGLVSRVGNFRRVG